MSEYEKIAFVLGIILLVVIIVRMLNLIVVSSSILLLFLIVLLYKLHFDRRIDEFEKKEEKRDRILDRIVEMIERISGTVSNIRNDFRETTFSIEQRMSKQKEELEKKMRKDYYDLADKIIDLENRTNKMKKILSTTISYLEEKIRQEEEMYE